MANGVDLSTRLGALTPALAGIAREHTSYSDFLLHVLKVLKEEVGCSRATYLCSSPNGGSGRPIVTGESYPADKTIVALEAEGLILFGEAITIQPTADMHFYKRSIIKEGVEHFGLVIQTNLRDRNELHTLSLSYDPELHPEIASAEEQDAAFDFVLLLAHLVNSKRLSEAEWLRDSRFNVMKEILSQTGSVRDVARKVCQIWRDWLKIPAIRLWAFNDEFNELNLLHACFDNQYEKLFEKSSNKLSSSSIGASAIAKSAIIRAENPMSSPEWDVDTGLTDVLGALPHLVCIPIISPDAELDSNGKPRFVGLIDLHVGDINSIDLHVKDISSIAQPDSRLLFLGAITATALLRARSFEQYEIIKNLNQMAIELVNPKDSRRLSERKQDYLSKVKNVILQAVNARCASIFEADESRNIIRCVMTTGIEGEEDFEKTVFYRAEEGLAWKVFASGEYSVLKSADPPDGAGYQDIFREKRTLPPVEGHDPHLIFPLPGQTPKATTGVIRIVERTCSIYRNRLQNFSNHDVDLLKLIAHQVSPALQMIRMQAHRELFVDRTAHQVNQPLQGVIAYSSNILEGVYKDDYEKERMKIRYIRQMARAAVGMMQSTIWASAFTDFDFLHHIEREPVKLTEYFIDRVIDLQPIREHEGIKVSFVNPDEANSWGDFLVDEKFFDQVVQNLLHNAVKYSYPGTKVELKVLHNGRELDVLISSTGVPIDESEKDRIFGDRERGGVAQQYDPQGTGQGLYIARQIMRGFGGTVLLESTVDDKRVVPPYRYPAAQKSTFRIVYPEAFPE
jgi:signal transduction histidine kinase